MAALFVCGLASFGYMPKKKGPVGALPKPHGWPTRHLLEGVSAASLLGGKKQQRNKLLVLRKADPRNGDVRLVAFPKFQLTTCARH